MWEAFPNSPADAILRPMSVLLEKAVASARKLPRDRQDDLARLMLQLVGEEQPVIPLTAEEEATFEESLAQEARGEFATDARIKAIWAKHGL
jgi:hypothetical protein